MEIKSQDKEKEYVEHLASGDSRRFALIFESYSKSILGIIFQIVKDEEQSQDILQEVFMKIWHNAASYDASKSRLFTWMLNIARNTAIDHIRSKDAQMEKNKRSIDSANGLHASAQAEYTGVKHLIEKLQTDQKEIIDLAFFEGYTHAEIAEKLNIPLGTVKTRCRRALKELRKIMSLS